MQFSSELYFSILKDVGYKFIYRAVQKKLDKLPSMDFSCVTCVPAKLNFSILCDLHKFYRFIQKNSNKCVWMGFPESALSTLLCVLQFNQILLYYMVLV